MYRQKACRYRENSPSFVLGSTKVDNSRKLPFSVTFWLNILLPNVDWKSSLINVANLETRASYHGFMDDTRRTYELSKVIRRFEFSFFRTGIEPMVECSANTDGGRFIFKLMKMDPKEIDRIWMAASYLMTHERFRFINDVCGIRLKYRSEFCSLEFWLRPRFRPNPHVFYSELLPFLPPSCSYVSYHFLRHRDYH